MKMRRDPDARMPLADEPRDGTGPDGHASSDGGSPGADQKRIEELESEIRRLSRVIEKLPVGIWVADAEGTLVAKNEEADRLWMGEAPLLEKDGYGRYAAWRTDTGRRLEPDEYPLARALAGALDEPVELRIRRFDGTAGTVLVYASAVDDGAGGPVGAVGIGIDITERKRYEDGLRKAKTAAERAFETRTRFLSTVSHELRTPLMAMVGLTHLFEAEMRGALDERQVGYLRRIREAGDHVVEIIDQILVFNRHEAEHGEPRLESANAACVVRGVVEMLECEARSRGLSMELSAADAPVEVVTDTASLRRIVTNLVANAIKYTKEGGVRVVLDADEHTFAVHVTDTGPGIPPDRIDEVFEAFVQLGDPSAPTRVGAGLGLAICRLLARSLSGDISVLSQPGLGSTFTVRLPRWGIVAAVAPERPVELPGHS